MGGRRPALAVLVLVSLVLVTVDYRQGDDGLLGALQRGAVIAFAPVQEGFATVVRPVGRFFGAIGEIGSLRTDNARLQAEVEQLRRSTLSRAELERQNAELRELLGMAERSELTTTGARVIAEPASAFDWSVLIDAGADQGLRPGQAVLGERGLVGRITEVTDRYARVQLIGSPEASYAIRVSDTGTDGLLRGQGSQPLQLEALDPEAQLPEGAEVVTKAFVGTAIPDGIPIGVLTGGDDDSRFRLVRPYVNFAGLDLVQVVVGEPTPPAQLDPAELHTEDAGIRPPPPPAPGAGATG